KQPDLKQCVHEAAQNGMSQLAKPFKEIDTPTLDPLEIPKMTIKGGTGTVAIDQNFKNCKMYSFDKTQFDKFEFDFDAKILAIDANFSKIVIKCEYQMDGKILFLPVRGQGPCTIIFRKCTVLGKFTLTNFFFQKISRLLLSTVTKR
ncbi:JHBP domain containing protein, partial [Asbolus verrucosus]